MRPHRFSASRQVLSGRRELRAEVESLLAAHDCETLFLQVPPARGAARPIASALGETTLDDATLDHPDDRQPTSRQAATSGYEVLECLGVGGMGEVYPARDTMLDRSIALKVLHETRDRRDHRMLHDTGLGSSPGTHASPSRGGDDDGAAPAAATASVCVGDG